MRVVFVVQVILLLCGASDCFTGNSCNSDENCLPFESCENQICKLRFKKGGLCTHFSLNWSCVQNTTCVDVPGLNHKMCMSNNNNCSTHADCEHGFRCIKRLGKCGLCHIDGQPCTLPYDNFECCSSYCAIHLNKSVCMDPLSHRSNGN